MWGGVDIKDGRGDVVGLGVGNRRGRRRLAQVHGSTVQRSRRSAAERSKS